MDAKRLSVILLPAVLIIVLITWLDGKYCLAGVAISPALVELNLEKRTAGGQFVIRNTGNAPERFRVMASHFVMTQSGSIKKVPPDKNSLVPWLKFNPKEFTLPPKSRRSVRFVVAPKGKASPNKEYWGFMELQSLKENSASATDKGGRTMTIKVIPAIIVPIFASKGKISYKASIQDIKIIPGKEDISIASLLKNTGSGHLLIKGNYEIVDNLGKIVKNGRYGKNYIMPGDQRELKAIVNEKLPEGTYSVNVEYSAQKLKDPLKDSISFIQ